MVVISQKLGLGIGVSMEISDDRAARHLGFRSGASGSPPDSHPIARRGATRSDVTQPTIIAESMEPYRNISGDSGVEAYECGDDWIRVRFRGGRTYLYDRTTPGSAHVERMQELARAGRGLGTYISRHVRRAYAAIEP